MKKLFPILSKKIQSGLIHYSLGLILNKENQTCTKIASIIGKSHDFLYRFLLKRDLLRILFPKLMIAMIKHFSAEDDGWLILDDTFLSKVFSRFLEGVYLLFNNAMGRPERGLCLVILCWSNGKVTVPIAFDWHFPKDVAADLYRKKDAVAEKLIFQYHNIIPNKYFLADAHYSTQKLLQFLCKNNIKFVMKIPRNRKVKTKDKAYEQLKLHPKLKLLRNQRAARTFAEYAGLWLYFSVQKRKDKNGEYSTIFLISNMNLSAKKYLLIYEGRWHIEVMIRTLKQSLGITQCQSAKIRVQEVHIYTAFFAYGFLQNEKVINHFKNPEAAIKHLVTLKLKHAYTRIRSFNRNFDYVA